jgi:hypothetical protein
MHGLFGWTDTNMASNNKEKIEEQEFILVEEDIPGASLPQESIEACSVVS